MDNAIFVGLSRQQTLQRELDVVSNNIANLDTAGFKVESLMLRDEPRKIVKAPGQSAINYAYDDGVARDYAQSTLRQTGGTFDMAIEGKGAFFAVQTPQGERYTRDGGFSLRQDGSVVTANDDQLLDDSGAPITIDPNKGQVTIAEDGAISQDGKTVAKVGVVTFDDLTALQKTGDNLLRNTSNQTANPATTAKVRQGMLENSNVNGVAEISRMIEVSRAYESVTKLMNDVADLSRRSVERMGAIS
ncbi:MAG: flagellar basal body rod protein [Caulobacteraceae bacterium]|nr:flagellar basal body rod protein [Caulobacteraceae bacterium]